MYNEIGRKLTSITLMAIMVAGGMTIAFPGFAPAAEAAHNANLFVSADNDTFENYFGGPQVIEVVIDDSDIDDTGDAKGEPDVTVNGKKLRMVQATDGNWYAYFAELEQAKAAEKTVNAHGEGLDFGNIFNTTPPTRDNAMGLFKDADGIAYGAIPLPNDPEETNLNVVREAKEINVNDRGDRGQLPKLPDYIPWPIIQLYDFNDGSNVVIQYNKGGGPQTTTLTFDTVEDYAGAVLDKSVYTQSAQLHATITDTWLNIDPTDEDSWTFDTKDVDGVLATHYQVYNENGDMLRANLGTKGTNLTNELDNLMCDDNCRLKINVNTQGAVNDRGEPINVITFRDNKDSKALDYQVTDNEAMDKLKMDGEDNITPDKIEEAKDSIAKDNPNKMVQPVTITEQGPNTGVFGTYDEEDVSTVGVTSDAKRGTSATFDYNDTGTTVLVGNDFATLEIQPVDDMWNSGETIPLVIVDGDGNKNSRVDEEFTVDDPSVSLIPALQTGDPFTLGEGSPKAYLAQSSPGTNNISISNVVDTKINVQKFSERAMISPSSATVLVNSLVIDLGTNAGELNSTLLDTKDRLDSNGRLVKSTDNGFNFYNQDVRSITVDKDGNANRGLQGPYDVYLLSKSNSDSPLVADGALRTATMIVSGIDAQSGLKLVNEDMISKIADMSPNDNIGLAIVATTDTVNTTQLGKTLPVVADFFSYGFTNKGELGGERVANQIIRIEVEESDDNTGEFEGELEYVMVNQLNILDQGTYEGLSTIASDPTFVVIEDFTDEDSVRVNYFDKGADGVDTQIADQQEAPTSSGVVSLDGDNYKVADTVTITLEDADLNVDSDLIEIYTIPNRDDLLRQYNDDINKLDGEQKEKMIKALNDASDTVGNYLDVSLNTGDLGRVLDVTFDDALWTTPSTKDMCGSKPFTGDTGLAATGFTLVETGPGDGVFKGDFQIPPEWCQDGVLKTTTGLDIEVNYVDFRDASGEIIEVGDSAGVRANTGSVSLDRTVYPVPFGTPDDADDSANITASTKDSTSPDGRSVFPVHQTYMNKMDGEKDAGLQGEESLSNGDLTIHVRVNDPDFDVSATGEDRIAEKGMGPVKISVIRGASTVVLGYAGGSSVVDGKIGIGSDAKDGVTQFGPITEIAPDAGIFEADIPVRFSDGPASPKCPEHELDEPMIPDKNDSEKKVKNPNYRFMKDAPPGKYCILQGDILQVEYKDPTDASGDPNTVTDSATFDLRNGVLQSDKSVYIIGSDIILTLIEPDFDLDNDQAETYDLDLIEWDSDAATVTMGSDSAFDPEPSDFRETGDSTGIFQVVIETPSVLGGDKLERGEEIELEYTDWGPSGSDFVGDEDEDVNLTIFTSNFGATVELDQKVYSWTDKVFITIVAPDHNFDSDLVDEIGDTDDDPIKVSTRSADLDNYKLVETGTNTGIFTGEVILTGFAHDADGDILISLLFRPFSCDHV